MVTYELICGICGGQFKFIRRGRSYCSAKCERTSERLRREVMKPEFRNKVFEKDQWTCHICGLGIEVGEESVDHVIPISKGGDNSENNVRAAHRNCNRKKHARLQFQSYSSTENTEPPS